MPRAYASGIELITSARPKSTAIIMRLRFTRSVQAPSSSPKNRYGEISAAVEMPRLGAEPVSRKTSSGSAKSVTELPRFEMVCPVQNFQKSALSRCLGACAMSTAIGALLAHCPRCCGQRTLRHLPPAVRNLRGNGMPCLHERAPLHAASGEGLPPPSSPEPPHSLPPATPPFPPYPAPPFPFTPLPSPFP